MKRLCVFCGSSLGQRPVYAEAARELGELLARKKIGL
jgi:predicted Rossmann-fold nucleotide-binding protein